MPDDLGVPPRSSPEESLYRRVIDSLTDGVYFVDADRRITYWNRGAERLTGYAAADVLQKCCADGLLQHVDASGRLLCHEACPMLATINDGAERSADVFLHHKAGHRVPVTVRAIPARETNGEIVGAVEIFNDISDRVHAEERIRELERLSLLDPLTGVGNRRYAEIQVASRLAEKLRHGLPVGLLFIDVDHFKFVNDLYSHAVGDEVLRVIGRTLRAASRASDFVARWGGEEFVVLVAGLNTERLTSAAERLRNVIAHSRFPSAPELRVTVSVGVTAARGDDTIATFVTRADSLMYEAKNAGRDRIVGDGER